MTSNQSLVAVKASRNSIRWGYDSAYRYAIKRRVAPKIAKLALALEALSNPKLLSQIPLTYLEV